MMQTLKRQMANVFREKLGYHELAKRYESRSRDDADQIHGALRALDAISVTRNDARTALLARLIGTSVCEGLYICDQLVQSLAVPGEVCEFGVAQGATSALLASEIMPTDRSLWLYDSFEGLPAPTEEDTLINDIFELGSIDRYKGTMNCGEDQVLSRLQGIKFPPGRCHVIKDFFENSPRTIGPERICFAYVDFDFYQPIRDALAFVDARMVAGGRVVVDDYGWFSTGAQKAVDTFIESKGSTWHFSLPFDFAGKFCLLEKRT
jgi:O-methyltransferase